ncbi:MAG: AAA family ATPase, partial [Selenomonadaceae bacterium]|nr:AAA family ATPase [Selenomonadaceae bacterium]
MLLRFSVQNFLSLKDRIEFNMVAGTSKLHPNHVIEKKGRKILRGGYIFGANASGKSNFISAVNFAKNALLQGLDNIRLDKMYFRVDEEYKNAPGVFQFDIYAENHFYSYGLAISYVKGEIVDEWLCEIEEDKYIFHRGVDEEENYFCESDVKAQLPETQNKFTVYREASTNKKMRKTFFLLDMALHSSEDDDFFKPFHDVIRWFQRLIIVFPESHYNQITRLVQKDSGNKLASMLNYFDTGIENVKTIEKDFEALDEIPVEILNDIKNEIGRALKNRSANEVNSIILNANGNLIELEWKNDKLYASKIGTSHGNERDYFEYQDESDGTKRLFNILPLYQRLHENVVILIDEIDRSLHTMATRRFIEKIYELGKNSDSQLIATLHDVNLLNTDIIRPDEIWFIERDMNHSSQMYSLSKFKLKIDSKTTKDYLMGRYGAIPIF